MRARGAVKLWRAIAVGRAATGCDRVTDVATDGGNRSRWLCPMQLWHTWIYDGRGLYSYGTLGSTMGEACTVMARDIVMAHERAKQRVTPAFIVMARDIVMALYSHSPV